MIVMPSADLDLAAGDVIKSAFGHAGQKCSAASLAILVGPVGRSQRFARQLVDAAASLRVGPPTDPLAEVGPVIEPPQRQARVGADDPRRGRAVARRAASRLRRRRRSTPGRFWSPGIRTGVQPGSRFHQEEFFGPVLGIMHANSLAQAIELQNAVAYGLTAGLYTQNPDDLAVWLDRVEAGNLYVNRGITGAIVQRQPFGGWKRSSVGAGTKAGGPNYLVGLGSWRATSGGAGSATLHLRGLDSRITSVIEAAQPSLDYEAFEWLRRGALSDAIAWDREFGQVKDVSGLGVERNLFRYRPISAVAIRATADATWQAVLRVAIAGIRAGSALTLSASVGLPAAVRRALSDQGIAVFVETDEQWIQRIVGDDRHRRRGGGCGIRSSSAARAAGRLARVGRRAAPRARRGRRRRPRPRGLRQRGDDGRAARAAAVPARAVDHDHRAPLRQPRPLVGARDLIARVSGAQRPSASRYEVFAGFGCSSAWCARSALSTAARTTQNSTTAPIAMGTT